jgi:hypothetical protein
MLLLLYFTVLTLTSLVFDNGLPLNRWELRTVGVFLEYVVVHFKHRLAKQLWHWKDSMWLYVKFTGNECLISHASQVSHCKHDNCMFCSWMGKVVAIKDEQSFFTSSTQNCGYLQKCLLHTLHL